MKNFLPLILCFASFMLNAQWVEVDNFPHKSFIPFVQGIGVDTAVVHTDSGLFMTHDDGLNWNKIGGVEFEQEYNDWFNSKKGIAKVFETSYKIRYTTNGGSSWTDIYQGEPMLFGFDREGNLFILENGSNLRLLRSNNNGQRWDTTAINLSSSIGRLIYVHNDEMIFANFGSDTLFRSSDGGQTFESNALLPNTYYTDIEAKSFDTLVYVAETYLARSFNGGKNWKKIEIIQNRVGVSADVVSLNGKYTAVGCSSIVSIDSAEVILRSTDYFDTWTYDTLIGYDGDFGIFRLDLIEANYGWASGMEGVYRLSPNNSSIREEKMAQTALKVGPNPFRNLVNIRLGKEARFKELEVYSINGKKVHSQSISKTQRNVRLKLDLETGMYIGVLSGDNQRETFKLLRR